VEGMELIPFKLLGRESRITEHTLCIWRELQAILWPSSLWYCW